MSITKEKLDGYYEPRFKKVGQIDLGLDQGPVEVFEVEKKYDCEDCQDTGEVSCMEVVYPGEPHMADVGTRPCHCQARDEDDYDDQE